MPTTGGPRFTVEVVGAGGGPIDTELSAVAAYAVDLSPPSAGGARVFPFLFDGTLLQPAPTMQEVVVVASGARTSFSQAVQANRSGFRGIIVHWRITVAGTGTVTLRVWNRADAANAFGEGVLIQTSRIDAGFRLIQAYPGLLAAAPPVGYDIIVNGLLGKHFYVDVLHSDGSSWTYAIGAALIP